MRTDKHNQVQACNKCVTCVFLAGNILAFFEEDARCFLFPEPKLVPSFSGVDQEVLMTRAPHFPVGPNKLLCRIIFSVFSFWL